MAALYYVIDKKEFKNENILYYNIGKYYKNYS
jgi:hypothetical protein